MVIAVAMAIIVATSLVVEIPSESIVGNEFQNAAHTLAFSLITFVALVRFKQRSVQNPFVRALPLCVGILLLGLVIECAQWLIARGFSPLDLVRNLLGVCVGGALSIGWVSSALRRVAAFAVAGLLLIGSVLPTAMFVVSGMFKPAMPTLADFEQWGVTHRLRRSTAILSIDRNDTVWPANTTRSAKVQFQADRAWSSITFLEVNPQWSNYAHMRFRVFNPQAESLRLYIRVDDSDLGPPPHNRMSVSRTVNSGESVVSIPLDEFREQALLGEHAGQPLMTRISNFVFFMGRLDESATLVFDDVALRN